VDSRTIDLGDGRSLYAVQAGDGPDLVLLHGALATHSDWFSGPFSALARDFRVTAVDRPGHGLSRRPRFEGTPRDQAAQIRRGLEALGVGRAVIVGHSMGGLVALALAEQFPQSVAALVLIAPIAFPEMRPLEHAIFAPRSLPLIGPLISSLGRATVDRSMIELVHLRMFEPQPVPAQWKQSYPWADVVDSDAMVREGEETTAILPFAPAGTIRFAAIEAPVLVVTGTADRIVDPNIHARRLAGLLPNGRLSELDGLGHMAHIVAADEIARAIAEAASSLATV
jgi:pimeloyl-ACP methyl ester carboxylesterase